MFESRLPPMTTRQSTSLPFFSSTLSSMKPSFRNILPPGSTLRGKSSNWTGMSEEVPFTRRVVSTTRSPRFRVHDPDSSWPMRILGPGRSPRMATSLPSMRDTCRIASMSRACWSRFPWLKLSLATFIPARMSPFKTCFFLEAGPIVHTILVLCFGNALFICAPSIA
ncbi:MAG: hypothetical protein BWZ01_01347 [Deltaproteobacteria bacterium ADurb.BinA179]|nr:MAG: hypothetical protein BWZ01_01347 [Deltaproteobacteria bacterium ADurb.BinA179]